MAELRAAPGLLHGYRSRTAPLVRVDHLRGEGFGPADLHALPGEAVALVGEDPARAAALLRALSGQLPTTGGTATVAGRDLRTDPAEVRLVTGLAAAPSCVPAATVLEELLTRGTLLRLSWAQARDRASELAFDLELRPALGARWDELTAGEHLRASIALALMHRPAVLLLDQPARGLSAADQEELRALLRMVRDQDGTTVLIATTDLAEAALLADRAVGC